MADITGSARFGEKNRIVVKLCSRESLNIPPFGKVIDYMTYGGIYRPAHLEILEHRGYGGLPSGEKGGLYKKGGKGQVGKPPALL